MAIKYAMTYQSTRGEDEGAGYSDIVLKGLAADGGLFMPRIYPQVTKTDPGFKGDTATNATKTATLETGAKIQVPMFVEEGETIRVDTRTGEYMERVK